MSMAMQHACHLLAMRLCSAQMCVHLRHSYHSSSNDSTPASLSLAAAHRRRHAMPEFRLFERVRR